jgi:hypothetical protein
MKPKATLMKARRNILAVVCALAIGPGEALAYIPLPRPAMPQALTPQDTASAIPADQLDSLVTPIALYPDPLLAQTLAASTYPLKSCSSSSGSRGTRVKDKALADAVAQQPWDPTFRRWPFCPTWSTGWRTTSSGRQTWEMHSWHSKPM